MHTIRGKMIICVLVACTLASATAAQADLKKNLMIGLNQFGYQFNLQKNNLGNGWDFYSLAQYRGQTYHMGFADLMLSGADSNISAGYTLRGIPSARFSLITNAPLNYTLSTNYGFQDFDATGSILIDIETSINALGFYDQIFLISNRGTYETDGWGLSDSGTLDFDAGPIVISGNVFVDMLACLTEPLFVASGTENPFAKLSQSAAKMTSVTDTIESLTARAADGQTLSDLEIGTLVNNTIVAAMLGAEPSSQLFHDVTLTPDALIQATANQQNARIASVPEPSTLALMTLAMLACYPRRRRH